MFEKYISEPTLILDAKKCIKNIQFMSEKAAKNELIFRPHFKTHQSRAVGKWFEQNGVKKITVSSIKMAEYFANDNWKDITVAFPVNIREIDRINALAEEIQLNLTIENIEAVKFLKKNLIFPVHFFIKIDTGYHRTGVSADNLQFINRILKEASASKNLAFKGFLVHSGDTYHTKNYQEIEHIFNQSATYLKKLKEIYQNDYPDIILSIGDTPSCSLIDDFKDIDEMRPGNFVFYDLMQYNLGACNFDQIAVAMACPVVAIHHERKEIIIHGGAVHFSKDYIEINKEKVYGQLVKLTKTRWKKL
ncbi:MAG: alanine racemase, partial [Bacteroidota bacterium]